MLLYITKIISSPARFIHQVINSLIYFPLIYNQLTGGVSAGKLTNLAPVANKVVPITKKCFACIIQKVFIPVNQFLLFFLQYWLLLNKVIVSRYGFRRKVQPFVFRIRNTLHHRLIQSVIYISILPQRSFKLFKIPPFLFDGIFFIDNG